MELDGRKIPTNAAIAQCQNSVKNSRNRIVDLDLHQNRFIANETSRPKQFHIRPLFLELTAKFPLPRNGENSYNNFWIYILIQITTKNLFICCYSHISFRQLFELSC